jgi:hypothetical protein
LRVCLLPFEEWGVLAIAEMSHTLVLIVEAAGLKVKPGPNLALDCPVEEAGQKASGIGRVDQELGNISQIAKAAAFEQDFNCVKGSGNISTLSPLSNLSNRLAILVRKS